MKKLGLISLLALPLIGNAATLSEVVQEMIKTNPNIMIKQEELYAQQEALTRVKSDYYPTLDLAYSVGPEVTRTPANERRHEAVNLTRQDASATFSQNLFSGLETMYSTDEQKAVVLSASEKLNDTINAIALETALAYLDVLRYKELYAIAQENTEVHERYLDQVKTRVEAGVGISSDYKQTLSRLENVKSVEYKAKLNFENALSNLQRLTAQQYEATSLEKPAENALPADSTEALVELAMQNNPLVLSTQANVDSARAGIGRANAAYYPTVDLTAQAYWSDKVHGLGYDDPDRPGTPNARDTEDSGYNALLVINYNVFNGMADSANKEISRHLALKEESSLVDVERSVTHGTTMSFNTYELLAKSIIHIENYIKATAETRSDYEKENDLGRRSIIDLLNINVENNNARNNKVIAEYDRLSAYYEVLSYTGSLLEEMNVLYEQ